jgi:hypothetical protein
MTIAGIIFFGIGLLIAAYASTKGNNAVTRIMPIMLYAWHTGICFFFWQSTLTDRDPDSLKYFSIAEFPMDFGFGTDFMFWITSVINSAISTILPSPTLLDFSLLFNIFGYSGILIIFKVLSDIAKPIGRGLLLHRLMIAFLPGLSFWTCSLGKDSLICLAIATVLYAAMAIHRRWLLLTLGLAVAFLVRPQVAVIFIGALGVQLLMTKTINPVIRILCAAGFAIAALGSLPFLAHFANLSSLDADVLNAAIDASRKDNMTGGGAIDTSNYNIFMSMFAYMFRPLFIDADGGLGYALSAENLLLIGLVGVPLVLAWREWPAILRQPFVVFNLAYFVVMLVLAGMSLSNFGIAARQKMMIVPSMMVLVTYLWVHRSYRKRAAAQQRAAARPPSAQSLPLLNRSREGYASSSAIGGAFDSSDRSVVPHDWRKTAG